MTEAELAQHVGHIVCVKWTDANAVLNGNPKHREHEPAPEWRTYGELAMVNSTRAFLSTSVLSDGSAADWHEVPVALIQSVRKLEYA